MVVNKYDSNELTLCFRELNDTYFSYYSITKKIVVFKPLSSPILPCTTFNSYLHINVKEMVAF
jgi:hypothetical protein